MSETKRYGTTVIALRSTNNVTVRVNPLRGWPTRAEAKWYRDGLRYGFEFNPTGDVQPGTRKYAAAFDAGVAEGREWLARYARGSNVRVPVAYKVGDRVTAKDDRATMVGTIVRVTNGRLRVRWSSGSERSYLAPQLQTVEQHPVVRKARNFIESHAFNRDGVGDLVAAANVAAEAMAFADELTRKHTAFPSFNDMIVASGRCAGAYRPTLRSDVDVELVALADLFDYVAARRGEDVMAFRG